MQQTTRQITDDEERAILSARAELASRSCDTARLVPILETLFVRGAQHSPAELNRRLDALALLDEHRAACGLARLGWWPGDVHAELARVESAAQHGRDPFAS